MKSDQSMILCPRYNRRIELENRHLQAFTLLSDVCPDCGEKVMLAQSSRNILDAEADARIICTVCFEKRCAKDKTEKFQVTVTKETVKEVESFLIKSQARRN